MNEQQERQMIAKVIQYEGNLHGIFEKEPLIFSQIIKVFNIPETQNISDSLHKLKERLVNICLQEKEEYLEYLSLPKFRQVSQHTLEVLKTSLQEIFERIKIELQYTKLNDLVNRIEKYIPKMISIAQIENYHLSVFDLYLKSSICPLGAMEKELGMISSGKNLQGEAKSLSNLNNSPYSNFVKSNPNQERNNYEYRGHQMSEIKEADNPAFYDRFDRFYLQSMEHGHQKPLSSEYIINKKIQNPSNLPIKPSSLQKSTPHASIPIFFSHMIEENSQTSIIKKQKHDENQKMIEEYSQSLSNVSSHRHKTFNAVDPNFKNCVCRGKIQKVGQEEFICSFCNCKFHIECLRRQTEVERKKKCPICLAEEVYNECFELIKPALFSSWIVESKNNPKNAKIKLSQSLITRVKNIICRPGHKIYLKLIKISKEISKSNHQNPNKPKFDDLKTISKQKIGQNEIVNESNEEDEQEIDQEESEMMEEEDENQENDNNHLNVQTKKECNPISSTFKSYSSIQLTSDHLSQLVNSPSSNLNINFLLSPESKKFSESFEEQRIIYYGIYEVQKKQLSEILRKMTCESRDETDLGFDQTRILELMKSKKIFEDEEKIDRTQENQEKNLVIKFLISKRQLRKISKFSEQQKIQLLPIRFTNCKSLSHVFELQNYLECLYNFNLNSKTQQNYNLKRFSPDTDITKCPLCVQKFPAEEPVIDESYHTHEKQHFYLDTKLHALINDHKTLKEIFEMYDDASSGEEYDYADVQIEMKFQRNFTQKNTIVSYSYVLIEQQKKKLQTEEEISQQSSSENIQNTLKKDDSDSMEVEDYLNDQNQKVSAQQSQESQFHQQKDIVDYGLVPKHIQQNRPVQIEQTYEKFKNGNSNNKKIQDKPNGQDFLQQNHNCF